MTSSGLNVSLEVPIMHIIGRSLKLLTPGDLHRKDGDFDSGLRCRAHFPQIPRAAEIEPSALGDGIKDRILEMIKLRNLIERTDLREEG